VSPSPDPNSLTLDFSQGYAAAPGALDLSSVNAPTFAPGPTLTTMPSVADQAAAIYSAYGVAPGPAASTASVLSAGVPPLTGTSINPWIIGGVAAAVLLVVLAGGRRR
jgi:hypothetical protein